MLKGEPATFGGISMLARFAGALVFAALLLPPLASAQTSTVRIMDEPAAVGATRPVPVEPLQIQDTDYPLESLLMNEEGSAMVNLLVDHQGKVAYVQFLTHSGSVRLDQQVNQIARTRWVFRPATEGGQPWPGAVKVEVAWKLPLLPADDIYSDMMGFSVVGKNIVLPKAIPETHRFRMTDYPIQSIRNGQQGEAAFRIQVLESGKVGEIETLDSSGYSLLDQAGRSFVQRFTYEPGMVDGSPAQ